MSTGAGKKATPTGVFEILQKKKEHYSNIYNNAPMPYMQRLTWSGICMHAGALPGYPASKGCVRLPYDFSNKLFSVTKMGGTVIITDSNEPIPQISSNPGLALAPAKSKTPAPKGLGYQWMPEKSKKGPVAILISGADKKMYVYRGGILIGSGVYVDRLANKPLGEHTFTLLRGTTNIPSTFVPGKMGLRWSEIDTGSLVSAANLGKRLSFSPEFTGKIYSLVKPGTSVVVTDESATANPNTDLNILSTD